MLQTLSVVAFDGQVLVSGSIDNHFLVPQGRRAPAINTGTDHTEWAWPYHMGQAESSKPSHSVPASCLAPEVKCLCDWSLVVIITCWVYVAVALNSKLMASLVCETSQVTYSEAFTTVTKANRLYVVFHYAVYLEDIQLY